eukprot:5848391-Amphidinium_carterae.2
MLLHARFRFQIRRQFGLIGLSSFRHVAQFAEQSECCGRTHQCLTTVCQMKGIPHRSFLLIQEALRRMWGERFGHLTASRCCGLFSLGGYWAPPKCRASPEDCFEILKPSVTADEAVQR